MRDEWVGTAKTDPIQVYFIPHDEVGTPGQLGMTFAPGMWAGNVQGRWERDLASDMRALEEEYEYHGYRIPEFLERNSIGSIGILKFAIEDMGALQEAASEDFEAFVQDVVQHLKQGHNVVVHCRGGLGRTGTLAACVLVGLGRHTVDETIAAVREARKGAIQTREQENFVRRLERTDHDLVASLASAPRRQLRTFDWRYRKIRSSCSRTSGWKISPNGSNGSR